MTWNLEWSWVAEQDLLNIPWLLAAEIDSALMAFCAGRAHGGTIQRMTATDPYRLRLRLRGVVALLCVDPQTRTVHVSRVFSSG